MNWTEKYRPKSLKDVIGNRVAKDELLRWAKEWERGLPDKRAVILYGKPGVGKTTCAHALATEFGWEVVELNASDERNRDIIRRIALAGAVNELIERAGNKRLIILDEADNLYEKAGDYGGKRAIVETIKVTRQPIILIANDYYALVKGSGAVLKNLCKSIEFKPVSKREIVSLLRKIATAEGMKVEEEVLNAIAVRCNGDVRSAINDLQSISYKKVVKAEEIAYLGYRDREKEIFIGLHEILRASDLKTAIRTAYRLNESPDNLILWIDENIPRRYKDKEDLMMAYHFLSRADVFLGRTWRRQHYGLWSYATELMTGGVAVAKKRHYHGFISYRFPQWLRSMSGSKRRREMRDAIAKKIGSIAHISVKKARELIPIFRKLCEKDAKIIAEMNFSMEELEFLIGDKAREMYEKAEESKKERGQASLFNFRSR